MNKEGYPSDIIAFLDGNDFGKTHRGRGKLDYRNWITASTAKVASSPAAASSPESSTAENKEEKRSYLPLGLSGVVVVIIVALAARRRRANARP
jgi:hypothetical protein